MARHLPYRGLPVRRVVALRPRLPLHLVAGRAAHRVPRHRERLDPGRHRHPGHLGRRRRLRRSSRVVRGRAVVGVRLGRDHPNRVLRPRCQVRDRVARARYCCLPVRRVVVLRPRLPLHLVAGRASHHRPRHRERPDAGRHRHPRHLGRRRSLRRSSRVVRGRAVVGIRLRRDHPNRVLRPRSQAGDRVARARYCCLPVRRVVALRPRFPLHLVARRAGHRRPRHRERPDAGRRRHPGHLGRRRRPRRPHCLRRGGPVVGVVLRRDHPNRVLRPGRQAGDRVVCARRRRLPAAVVALRPGLPLHLVARRVRHRRPRHRERPDAGRHRHARHLAGCRRLRRPLHFRRGGPVVGVRLRRDHPHRVFRARRQAGDGVARARRRGLPARLVVVLRPGLPLHLVAGRAAHRRPRHRE